MTTLNTSRTWLTGLMAALAMGGVAGLASCSSNNSEPIEIRTASNRADLVSGGDVLVELMLPAGAGISGLRVTAGGRDVTSAFSVTSTGRIQIGRAHV